MSAVSQHLRRRYRLPVQTKAKDIIRDNQLDEILYRDPHYVTDISINSQPEGEMTAGDPEPEPPGGLKLAACPTCQRTFADDRLDAHKVICEKTTNNKRKVYDVAQFRIEGTEVAELVKKGKVNIEPAKPFEKKSDLMKKYGTGAADKSPAAANQNKLDAKPKNTKTTQKGNTEAYQVYFDDKDKMKTRKPGVPMPRPGTRLPSQLIKTDRSRLSASWQARNHVSPDLNSLDDSDFLNSSMTSNKSVASDAFDFLFDEKNLDPEKVLDDEFQKTQKVYSGPNESESNTSSCCVIS